MCVSMCNTVTPNCTSDSFVEFHYIYYLSVAILCHCNEDIVFENYSSFKKGDNFVKIMHDIFQVDMTHT